MVSLVVVHIAKKLVVARGALSVCVRPHFRLPPRPHQPTPPSFSLLLRPMDTQTGHLTAFSGGETIGRRGVWVRKPVLTAVHKRLLFGQRTAR